MKIQVQSILFNNSFDHITRALYSLGRSSELAITAGVISAVHVSLGDCSSSPCLSTSQIQELTRACAHQLTVQYTFFNENLGSARGHNRLAQGSDADYFLIQNPDVVVSPRLLEQLVKPFARPSVGMVEAKQLPIEHPKAYDPVTGETDWATTACALIPGPLFRQLDGFDADSFFLYCDDVDFSWRVRLAGLKVIFNASAVVFHDKRLSDSGAWMPSGSEHYYSAEAAMLLAHKWSRSDLADAIQEWMANHGDDSQKKAAAEYSRRKLEGKLVPSLDPSHKIGKFLEGGGAYTKHRYPL
jgi:GT2 family glycosyltransferase